MLVELRLVEQRYQAVLEVLNDGAAALGLASSASLRCSSRARSMSTVATLCSAAVDEPSRLDQHGPRRAKVDRRWRLRINAVIEPDL